MPRRLALAAIALIFLVTGRARELRLEVAADHASIFQVFYGHAGLDFSEAQAVTKPFAGGGTFQELSFELPDWEPLSLRLDPGLVPGRVALRRVRLYEQGRLIGALPVAALEPLHDLQPRPADSAEVAAFTVPPGRDDPYLVVNELALRRLLASGTSVTGRAFAVALGFLGVLLAGGSVLALRGILSGDRQVRREQWLLGTGLLLFAAGVRLTEMSGNASWAPYLDEFEGELATLIRPFRAGVLQWSDFAAPHNDHRITTTRLASLGAFLLNGEWDNRVLVVANCLLQAASVAWLAIFLRPHLARRDLAVILGLLVGTTFLLNDWANLVVGFQLQFHLVLLSSLVCLGLLATQPAGSVASWAGFGAGVFAAASLGSGFVALVAAGAGLVVRMWLDRRTSAAGLALLLLSLVVAVYAWEKRAIFPAHDFLKAQNAGEFFLGLWTYGAWPLGPNGAGLFLLWLPWGWCTLAMLRRRRASPAQVANFSLGVWLLLQILALAYGRAGFAPVMSSRYTGMLAWSCVVAVLSLVVIRASGAEEPGRPRRLLRLAPAGVAALLFGALAWQSATFLGAQLAGFRTETREQENRLGTFMRYDDPKVFTDVDFPHKPYPSNERLVALLRDPYLRDIYPAPLQRERVRFSDPAALGRVRPGPLTQAARGILGAGPWIALAGLAVLAALGRRRGSHPPGRGRAAGVPAGAVTAR